MRKLVLEVYIVDALEGMKVMFLWPAGAREAMERCSVLDTFGEALASFGEQLRLQGLGQTVKGPALIYGPNGKPVA